MKAIDLLSYAKLYLKGSKVYSVNHSSVDNKIHIINAGTNASLFALGVDDDIVLDETGTVTVYGSILTPLVEKINEVKLTNAGPVPDMNTPDRIYQRLLHHVLYNGVKRQDRTGTGTISVFGTRMEFDLAKYFPLLHTKEVHFKSVAAELAWFIRGDTNIRSLLADNVNIWNDWRYKHYVDDCVERDVSPMPMTGFVEKMKTNATFAIKWGDIGKGYGHQWRNYGAVTAEVTVANTTTNMSVQAGFDQLSWLIQEIKLNPTSRRLILNGWNPQEADKADLPPCHVLAQFSVHEGALSCQLYQRSADLFLGVPFNIASYSMLTHFIAAVCGLRVGKFVWVGGDTHIYSNHVNQVRIQLSRNYKGSYPRVHIDVPAPNGEPSLDLVSTECFSLIGEYVHMGKIKAPVAV